MHKIPGFGAARHGFDKVTPSMPFGSQRQQPDMGPAHAMSANKPRDAASNSGPASLSRQSSGPRPGQQLSLSFNVPFSSNVPGPEPADVIHATPGAFHRWTHQDDDPAASAAVHQLPIHTANMDNLRTLCKSMSDMSEGRLQASVTCSEPKQIPGLPLGGSLRSLVTNVCLAGEPDAVKRMRCRILHETPISLVRLVQREELYPRLTLQIALCPC